MALTMLTFAACDNGKDKTPSNNDSSNQSSQQDVNVPSTEEPSEENSDVENSSSNQTSNKPATINPLKGEISNNYDYDTSLSRTDLYEVEPVVDPSNLAYGYVGYAEDERNELLEE